MSQDGLLLKSPIRSTRVVASRWLSAPRFFLKAFILTSYRETIERGLKSGLTKTDLALMRETCAYFSSPVCRNTLLFKIRARLELLRICSYLGLQNAKLSSHLRRILYHYETSTTEKWNPSLPRSTMALTQAAYYELQLHVIPSPFGFNWETPRGFLWSLRNYLAGSHNHKIGHALIVLKKEEQIVAATGMTGETNFQAGFDLLFRWIGLELLFRTYRGRLEDHDFILRDIAKHQERRHIQDLRFDLTEEQFNRCLAHLKMWCEQGRYKNYGLPFDTGVFSGASCTSYALNFLAVAGLLTDEHRKNWKRKVQIPDKYFSEEGNRVGLPRLIWFLLTERRWKKSSYKTIEFWDPDLMHDWIRNQKRAGRLGAGVNHP